jgi:hypothetical protein
LGLGIALICPSLQLLTACDSPPATSQSHGPVETAALEAPTFGGSDLVLRTGTLAAPRNEFFATRSARSKVARALVLHFKPSKRPTAQEIQSRGMEVIGLLSGDSFLVRETSHHRLAPNTFEHLEWAAELPPALKISPRLSHALSRSPTKAEGPFYLTVEAIAGTDFAQLDIFGDEKPWHLLAQARTVQGQRAVIEVESAGFEDFVNAAANLPQTFWIDRRSRRVLLNDTSNWVGQSGVDGGMKTPIYDAGLHGEGQIGALLDTGVDLDHCHFWDDAAGKPPTNRLTGTEVDLNQRKIIAYDFIWDNDKEDDNGDYDDQGHGSHVAGTIAGDQGGNATHNDFDGMAPAAKLVVQDGGANVSDTCADLPGIGCPVVELGPFFAQAYAQGARVHSNSWGDREDEAVQNDYSDACVDVDSFVWEHPDFLLVFAAGNFGPDAGSVCSPSISKSALSVGATGRASGAESLTGFSSRGPTEDGRIKPDVTFPGSQIVSAKSDKDISTMNCGSGQSSGTSMAAPGASGLALLVRQYFVDGYYPSGAKNGDDSITPSAALIKATMIASAANMKEEPIAPSLDQGWGRITLERALAFEGGNFSLFVDDEKQGLQSQEQRTYTAQIDSSAQRLGVTLVWSDYPAMAAAKSTLVNDLDLEVRSSDGSTIWRGNVFDGGESKPDGEADRVNNVERVELAAPEPGTYEVIVSAHDVPMGPQPFALVITTAGKVDSDEETSEGASSSEDGESTMQESDDPSSDATSESESSNTDVEGSTGSDEASSTEPDSSEDPSEASEDGESSTEEDEDENSDAAQSCACDASKRMWPPTLGALFAVMMLRRRRRASGR